MTEYDAPCILHDPATSRMECAGCGMQSTWCRACGIDLCKCGPVQEQPDAPVNVRLIDPDGNEHPVDCVYVDTTDTGIRRWYVLAHEGPWRGIRVDELPALTELIVSGGGGE